MKPTYIEQLANRADPDELWRLPVLTQLSLPAQQRRQLDTGVALRRYASHLQELHSLIDTDRSLLITPLSRSGVAVMSVPTPAKHKKLLAARKKHHL